eukprot:Gregarina_sp_Poly_1__3530@NODE_202_length_11519_cov_188_798463_g180_i0_p3_GENE_NODE_202_length_11519_cov_188_798463_g180_i0NODE_202_length_11519_cov_188_798463_g180_i0_p3_ORF_typecomplete_len454_score89_19IIGP/PF05049_13/1_1e53MMR_HSR1/PF01926_23/2_1e03MMR_HSR1/PF01926_23/2_9e07RsgA_GTPase/PF03193_16/0_00034RsgA_GTPase/PF03193_16/98FeoB_N/PF02421_18/6e05AIG1/PF04548_16/9_2e02AIG1/PF04548_16/0_00027AAA_21/PF13304_6/79AAA_21/PF13304_6/0_087PV1/PF06637_11/0_0026MeaB/PF03308_16/2_5e03MeaB/PF03308_16
MGFFGAFVQCLTDFANFLIGNKQVKDLEQLHKAEAKLEAALEIQRQKNAKLEEERKKIEAQLNAKKKAAEEFRKQLEVANDKQMALQEQITKLREQANNETKELREANKKTIADLEAKLVQLNKEAEVTAKKKQSELERQKEEAKKLEETKTKSEKQKKEVEAEIEKIQKRKEKLEVDFQDGRMLKIMPTREEFEATKKKYGYRDDMCHIAITGLSGAGKSSFINAIRGVADQSKSAARVGVAECTDEVERFSDPNPDWPIVWFDVPGAGTLKCPKAQYFTSQGLWVFDYIIVLTDSRFTETDMAILDCCRDWNIPTMVVRSKSDLHVNDLAEKYLSSREENEGLPWGLWQATERDAIAEYRSTTIENIESNLRREGLPEQELFLVSRDALRGARNDPEFVESLDERALLEEVIQRIIKDRAPRLWDRIASTPKFAVKNFKFPARAHEIPNGF